MAGKPDARAGHIALGEVDLPAVLYVRELALFLGRTEKAVRNAVSRGTLPPGRRVAGRLAWTRADVLSWLSETRGVSSKAETSVKIKASPYPRNPARFLVTFELPTTDQHAARNRTRKVAPFGLDEKGAIAWGHSILGDVLRECMDKREDEPPPTSNVETQATTAQSMTKAAPQSAPPSLTFGDFWHGAFAGYRREQAYATQYGYDTLWKNYFGPCLAALPLDSIGKNEITLLRSKLSHMKASSRNGVVKKLRRIFEIAVESELIDAEQVPRLKNEKAGAPEETPTYTFEEIGRLVEAARKTGPEALGVLLLMLDTDMRVSEVCAVRWSDVDSQVGIITVRHNYSNGKASRPKGKKPKPVGITPALASVIGELPHLDEHLLVRSDRGETGRWTPCAIRHILVKLADMAGVPRYSPHKVRHTGGTAKARNGAPGWVVQASLRHSRLSTTQDYIHLDAVDTARQAAGFAATTRLSPATDWPPRPPEPKTGPILTN